MTTEQRETLLSLDSPQPQPGPAGSSHSQGGRGGGSPSEEPSPASDTPPGAACGSAACTPPAAMEKGSQWKQWLPNTGFYPDKVGAASNSPLTSLHCRRRLQTSELDTAALVTWILLRNDGYRNKYDTE